MTKKNVLRISSAYIIYLVVILLISATCRSNWCKIQEDGPLGFILFSFAPLIPVFFFSIITYKIRDEVFRAWWNFARWWVPVIVVITFLLENASGGGGGLGIGGAVSGGFTVLILALLYYVFIAISLARITHVYLKLKWQEETYKIKLEKLNKTFKWVYGVIILPLALFILGVVGLMLFD